ALDHLDALRAAAFAGDSPALLAEVYAPGCPALAQDRAALAALARSRRTAVGVRHTLGAVTALASAPDQVLLEVREALAAYQVRSATGDVLERHPPGPSQRHRVVLRRVAGSWRVESVRSAA
ncbi:MAG: hypothetical protein WCD35_11285, partial [Mycobacteriales bacterium]